MVEFRRQAGTIPPEAGRIPGKVGRIERPPLQELLFSNDLCALFVLEKPIPERWTETGEKILRSAGKTDVYVFIMEGMNLCVKSIPVNQGSCWIYEKRERVCQT
ncbi:MAG: hypothetical protein EA344_04640 [Alkalicoccus sp.]|nr:MAG: hypothetical protein EA344_04640 [Alkalicoccus sp.]